MDTATQTRIHTICLAIIATAVVTFSFYWLRPVLQPFVVALIVVSGIMPLLESLEKRLSVNRMVAAAIAFVLGLMILVVLGFCLWLSVTQMTERGPAYRERISQLIDWSASWTNFSWTNPTGQASTSGEAPGTSPAMPIEADRPATLVEDVAQSAGNLESFREFLDGFVRQSVSRISTEFLGLITTSMVVLIYVYFLLAGATSVAQENETFQKINYQVRSYLTLKTVISIFTGLCFGLVLWIFGVPMALTFGVLAFLLNYIPNIGPIVASLLPIPLIVLEPNASLIWMIAVIGGSSSVQMISGNLIEPKLMGQSSDLHPVVVLLALMFWGMMWGITGMFLATPMTAAIKIVLDGFESTKPIANLLAGRWTPELI